MGRLKSLEDIRERFIVIDFQNTLWKSWMVKPQGEELARVSDGYPTGHVYRFWRTLYKWKREFVGEFVFCYEGDEKFRFELFPEYKAGRNREQKDFDPEPDVLRMISLLKCIELKPIDAEADDAIAAFIHKRPEAQHLIISSDKDLWALRGPRVQIVSFRGILNDADIQKSCIKHFGTPNPKSVTLAKALYGDKSDNLPKVNRLLKKHVASVLEKTTTPDEFFESLDGVPEKTVAKLHEHEAQVRKVYRAVQLRTDVRLKRRVRKGKPAELRDFLREFECESLLPQVDFLTK